MLRKAGGDEPKKYNYHFKHMTTVGEPIEPEVWRWYYDVVGKKEAAIVDTCGRPKREASSAPPNRARSHEPGSAGPPRWHLPDYLG